MSHRRGRGAGPPHRRQGRAGRAAGGGAAHLGHGPAAGWRQRQGRIREPPEERDRRGQEEPASDHPVPRRSAHHDRCRR
ncbi:hypothetical protein G6F58_013365 [Rhizopus delemar]|nr:hypothetical protein G6F58_013365 [Rhizopus delemar]